MFIENPRSKFWSHLNKQKPNEIALNSHKKFWFDYDCGHTFEGSLLNINKGNNWCPYCSNPPKKMCNDEKCVSCFNQSFASHEKSKYWSNENKGTPRQVFKNADRKKYIFDCVCGHTIYIGLKNISSQGNWCSYCSHQKLCDNINCKMCFDNSFASVDRSKFLNDKNINARFIFKKTNKKFKFDCDVCYNIFETQISDITSGIWCPFCVNKTELILYNKLVEKYSLLQRQYKVDWCKNKTYLPFDFALEDVKIIIELDGKQHFEQIGNWISPEENRKKDLYKMKCANENGFSVIRILQKDVYKNIYDWISELVVNIKQIIYENRVQNIYMCKNNEYKDFDL